MPTVAAGRTPDGTFLTGAEASVLVSINEWALINAGWYLKMRMMKTGIVMGTLIAVIGAFLSPLLIIFGAILAFASIITIHISNPRPVKLNPISATQHSIVEWAGVKHIITMNQDLNKRIIQRDVIGNRNPHDPSSIAAADIWQQGNDEFKVLSLQSADSLIQTEKTNIQCFGSTTLFENSIPILLNDGSSLAERIFPLFPDESVLEDVMSIITKPDAAIGIHCQKLLDWIMQTLTHNIDVTQRSYNEMSADHNIYCTWSEFLANQGNILADSVLDSSKLGWSQASIGLDSAERSLENSVASDIIAQEELVMREVEQAEARIREKGADHQINIAEKNEKLQHKLSEIGGMYSSQEKTVSLLNQISVEQSLTLQNSYGIVSGGGGSVSGGGGYISSVSTSVKTDYYSIANPAWDTMIGLRHIANGELKKISSMHLAVSNEIRDLEQSHSKMLEHLKAQHNERMKELEKAKERALLAIRKDSMEVRSIQKLNAKEPKLSEWEKLNSSITEFWLRPHRLVQEKIDKHWQCIDNMQRLCDLAISEKKNTNSIMSGTPFQRVLNDNLIHHWVLINGRPFSEIIPFSMIEFNENSSVQVEEGSSAYLLGMNATHLNSVDIDDLTVSNSLARLVHLSLLDQEVALTFNKQKQPFKFIKRVMMK